MILYVRTVRNIQEAGKALDGNANLTRQSLPVCFSSSSTSATVPSASASGRGGAGSDMQLVWPGKRRGMERRFQDAEFEDQDGLYVTRARGMEGITDGAIRDDLDLDLSEEDFAEADSEL